MKARKIISLLTALAIIVTTFAVFGAFSVSAATSAVEITDAQGFANISDNLDGYYVLKNDIDLTSSNTMIPGSFTGTIDGQGYAIKNISETLFSEFNGTLKNVTITGAVTADGSNHDYSRHLATVALTTTGCNLVNVKSAVDITSTARDLNGGALIGYNNGDCILVGCEYSGTYTMTWTGADGGVGGLIGWSGYTVDIDDCHFTGKIVVNGAGASGNELFVGGLIGRGNGHYRITNSSSSGEISVENVGGAHGVSVGGLIGYNQNGITITGSSFSGKVSVKNESTATGNLYTRVGGLIGKADEDATITSCVINGGTVDVSGVQKADEVRVGGFIGSSEGGNTFNISDCVVKATVTPSTTLENSGNYRVGLMLGHVAGSDCKMTNCFDISDSTVNTSNLAIVRHTEKDITKTNVLSYADILVEKTIFEGEYVKYNFGLVEAATSKLVTLSSTDGKFAMYISTRENGTDAHDARLVILANMAELETVNTANVTVEFTKGGNLVKGFTKVLGGSSEGAITNVYEAVEAAGVKYFAADDYAYFGLILTGIGNDDWDTVTAKIVDAEDETNILLDTVKAISPYAVTSSVAKDIELLQNDDIRTARLRTLSLIVDDETFTAVSNAMANDSAVWSVSYNGAKHTIDKSIITLDSAGNKIVMPVREIFETSTGLNRFENFCLTADMGTSAVKVSSDRKLFYNVHSNIVYDEDRNSGNAVDIIVTDGADTNSNETYTVLADNNTGTKLCTKTRADIIFEAAGAIAPTGFSIVTANDNNGNTNNRLNASYKLWATNDKAGTWTELKAWTMSEMSINNYTETYFALDTQGEAYQYYKIEFGDADNSTDTYQYSEIWLFSNDTSATVSRERDAFKSANDGNQDSDKDYLVYSNGALTGDGRYNDGNNYSVYKFHCDTTNAAYATLELPLGAQYKVSISKDCTSSDNYAGGTWEVLAYQESNNNETVCVLIDITSYVSGGGDFYIKISDYQPGDNGSHGWGGKLKDNRETIFAAWSFN